jgi:Flp pilus assembly protein TadD
MKRVRKTMRTRASASALVIALMGAPIGAVQAQPEPAAVSPGPLEGIVLKDVKGGVVRLTDLVGQPLILVFGEVDQSRTRTACEDLAALLAAPEMRGANALPVLITTRIGTPSNETAPDLKLPERRLLDPDRDAFGAFHVIVMPTIVVLDKEGQRVHSMPGFLPRMPETVLAAVRFARGEITRAAFDEVLKPHQQVRQTDDQKHAARLVLMADKLRTRGMLDAAVERFNEAIALDPEQVGALIGLGRVWAQRRELEKALEQYRRALKIEPESIDALLGIAFVLLERGGDDAEESFRMASKLAESSPEDPRVHFLLGTIHDRFNRCEEACASFRRSAELMLDRLVVPAKN